MSFKGITAGSRVTFMQNNGLRINWHNGRTMPDRKKVTAKVNPLLIFETHVVVGGGMGQVVNEENYVSHKP